MSRKNKLILFCFFFFAACGEKSNNDTGDKKDDLNATAKSGQISGSIEESTWESKSAIAYQIQYQGKDMLSISFLPFKVENPCEYRSPREKFFEVALRLPNKTGSIEQSYENWQQGVLMNFQENDYSEGAHVRIVLASGTVSLTDITDDHVNGSLSIYYDVEKPYSKVIGNFTVKNCGTR